MVEIDDTLNFVELVLHLRQLRLQECLLGGEDFKIGCGTAVLQQQTGAADGITQGCDLLGIYVQTFLR